MEEGAREMAAWRQLARPLLQDWGKWSHSVVSDSCDPTDCSPPGSSVHGILQARILERVAISSSRGSSWPRDWTLVSHTAGRRFTVWAPRGALEERSQWPRSASDSGSRDGVCASSPQRSTASPYIRLREACLGSDLQTYKIIHLRWVKSLNLWWFG